jgi:hypothetical protein
MAFMIVGSLRSARIGLLGVTWESSAEYHRFVDEAVRASSLADD